MLEHIVSLQSVYLQLASYLFCPLATALTLQHVVGHHFLFHVQKRMESMYFDPMHLAPLLEILFQFQLKFLKKMILQMILLMLVSLSLLPLISHLHHNCIDCELVYLFSHLVPLRLLQPLNQTVQINSY